MAHAGVTRHFPHTHHPPSPPTMTSRTRKARHSSLRRLRRLSPLPGSHPGGQRLRLLPGGVTVYIVLTLVMDLNGNLNEQISTEETEENNQDLPESIKNLKRKAQHASVFPQAKFPAEYQPLPSFTQVFLQSTTGKRQEQVGTLVFPQEVDGRTRGSRWISWPVN